MTYLSHSHIITWAMFNMIYFKVTHGVQIVEANKSPVKSLKIILGATS